MASLNDLVIFITLFLSLSPHSASPAPASNSLLESTCKKTHELYSSCMEILGSNPETASASSSLFLAGAALKFGAEDTKINREKLTVSLKSKINRPRASEANTTCVDWFNMAARAFNASSTELEDPQSANYDAALADSHESADCQKALASAGIHVPEIEALIKRLRCFCRIAYAVTDNLMQGS